MPNTTNERVDDASIVLQPLISSTASTSVDATPTSQINITDLPDDIIQEIFSHLNHGSFIEIPRVCKLFYRNVQDADRLRQRWATLHNTYGLPLPESPPSNEDISNFFRYQFFPYIRALKNLQGISDNTLKGNKANQLLFKALQRTHYISALLILKHAPVEIFKVNELDLYDPAHDPSLSVKAEHILALACQKYLSAKQDNAPTQRDSAYLIGALITTLKESDAQLGYVDCAARLIARSTKNMKRYHEYAKFKSAICSFTGDEETDFCCCMTWMFCFPVMLPAHLIALSFKAARAKYRESVKTFPPLINDDTALPLVKAIRFALSLKNQSSVHTFEFYDDNQMLEKFIFSEDFANLITLDDVKNMFVMYPEKFLYNRSELVRIISKLWLLTRTVSEDEDNLNEIRDNFARAKALGEMLPASSYLKQILDELSKMPLLQTTHEMYNTDPLLRLNYT